MFQVAFAIKGFQRVAGVKLPGAKEGLETKTAGVGAVKQRHHESAIVASQNAFVVIPFAHQRLQAFLLTAERDRVGANMGGKKGVYRLPVLIELNTACFIVQIQHGVQRMVIQ